MEFCLGQIPKESFDNDVGRLKAGLNSSPVDFIFKNIMCSSRKGETFLWLTMQPETSQLNLRTVTDLIKVTEGIKNHAELDWRCSTSVRPSPVV